MNLHKYFIWVNWDTITFKLIWGLKNLFEDKLKFEWSNINTISINFIEYDINEWMIG